MKLILASDLSFLLKCGYDLTFIPKEQMKIGYVTTASKVARMPSFFSDIKNTIREHGYKFEEIDIEEKTKNQLRNFFSDKNIIHIEGGNTFYLLKAIRETGFDEILKKFITEGKVFIGTSAGAYVMCPTIEVSDWNKTGKERFGVSDFTALGYVPFVLKAHYEVGMKETINEKKKTLRYPLRILRDGQGIAIEDGKFTFAGDGEEVVI